MHINGKGAIVAKDIDCTCTFTNVTILIERFGLVARHTKTTTISEKRSADYAARRIHLCYTTTHMPTIFDEKIYYTRTWPLFGICAIAYVHIWHDGWLTARVKGIEWLGCACNQVGTKTVMRVQ